MIKIDDSVLGLNNVVKQSSKDNMNLTEEGKTTLCLNIYLKLKCKNCVIKWASSDTINF